MTKCFKCGAEATHRLTPDLDVRGVGACDKHLEEIKDDLLMYVLGDEEIREWFEKKYKLK